MKQPKTGNVTYVLGIKLPKSRVLWYWCGGANPRFMDPEEAVKYPSFAEARTTRRAIRESKLGTYVIVKLTDARLRYRRRQRRLAA